MSITSRCVVLRHALARPEGPRGKRSRLARSILRRECKYIFSKFFSQSAQKQLQSLCGYAIITKLLTRPCGQAVKTAPSHGAIPGSIPGKVTSKMSRRWSAHFLLVTLSGARNGRVCPTRSGARPTRARNVCLQGHFAAVAHESRRIDVARSTKYSRFSVDELSN